MGATGIIRRLDDLGRIAIPKEIRRSLKLRAGDPLEICVEKEDIVLRKYFALELSRYCKVASNALDRLEVKYAIYDREERLYTNSPDTFLYNLPTSWRRYNWSNVMQRYIDNDISIQPIISNGEFLGCIAAKNVRDTDPFLVVASMISDEMTVG